MGGLTLVVASAAGRASSGRPPWAWSRPGLPAWSVAASGQHRKRRFVRGAQRLGATQGSNDPARTASTVVLCATLPSTRWPACPATSGKGGSIGSYALRAFDDTRDLKSSRRRRNPALNGVSPTHNTYPWNYPRYVYEFNLQKRERDGWARVGMGKGGGRERGGLAG